jgi:hypothetical protein
VTAYGENAVSAHSSSRLWLLPLLGDASRVPRIAAMSHSGQADTDARDDLTNLTSVRPVSRRSTDTILIAVSLASVVAVLINATWFGGVLALAAIAGSLGRNSPPWRLHLMRLPAVLMLTFLLVWRVAGALGSPLAG